MSDVNRIDIKEFRELGYLQEVNRQFLHPLGLALEVVRHDDGTEKLGGVWDYRDDPEGMNFHIKAEDVDDMERKANHVNEVWDRHMVTRDRNLGYIVQPIEANA